MLITGGAAALVGILLGVLSTAVTIDRREYNQAVRDGKAIYEGVRVATDQVAEAKRLLDRASAAAKSRPGQGPSVDYEAIEKLRVSSPTTLTENPTPS